MAALDLTSIGISREASDVIASVITGDIDPELGATRLSGIWVPAEELGTESGRQTTPPPGSVAGLDSLVSELMTAEHTTQARRLAELNWLLVKHAADEDTAVRCAATLAQLLVVDPAAVRRRLDLLEYAVPPIITSNRSEMVKAALLCNLADARFNAAGGDPDALSGVVDASTQAVSIGADVGDAWLSRMHFIAGTALQTLGDLADDEDHYRESIDSLTEVLRYCGPERHPDTYASALNNLGNTYRKLGARTSDAALVHEAMKCYDLALPYRRDASLIGRTQVNRAAAVRLLETLSAQAQAQGPPRGDRADAAASAAAFLEAGDAAFTDQRTSGSDWAFRRLAIDRFLAAAKLTDRNSPPDLRAKLYHRLSAAFAGAEEDDALWSGVCFASAALRLGSDALPAVQLARMNFHIGFMLMKLGLPDQLAYLRKAEAMLRDALPTLESSNEPGEHDYANNIHGTCQTLLAAFGDENACAEALSLNAAQQLLRIDSELRAAPADKVHAAYRDYLSLVRESAGPELAAFLASSELARVRAYLGRSGEYGATVLARTAAARRDVGDLSGALKIAAEAEIRATDVIFFAPATWCQLASFYVTIPATDDAERCLRSAKEAAGQTELAGAPGEPDEIKAVVAAIASMGSRPRFDPAVTAATLIPAGDADRLRSVLEQGIRSIEKAES